MDSAGLPCTRPRESSWGRPSKLSPRTVILEKSSTRDTGLLNLPVTDHQLEASVTLNKPKLCTLINGCTVISIVLVQQGSFPRGSGSGEHKPTEAGQWSVPGPREKVCWKGSNTRVQTTYSLPVLKAVIRQLKVRFGNLTILEERARCRESTWSQAS